jgi:hypothetical protein
LRASSKLCSKARRAWRSSASWVVKSLFASRSSDKL